MNCTWTQRQTKLCQTIAPQCSNARQLLATYMPPITYTPDHTRMIDWVSSRLTIVQTGHVAQFVGSHAHVGQIMVATSCGSHAVIECCLIRQHTNALQLMLKHDFT
jgi:hypothetical protein